MTDEVSMTRIKSMLADDNTRPQALDELGKWAKDNCLLFGSTPTTAYQVAATLVRGIEATYEEEAPQRGWLRKKAQP